MGIVLDGSNDTISFPVANQAINSFHYFVRHASMPGVAREYTSFAEDVDSGTHEKYWILQANGTSDVTFFDGASKTTTPRASAQTTGVWYGVGASQDGTTGRHYQDGVQAGSIACGTYTGYSTPVFEIAHNEAGAVWAIAEVAIWNAALTADEFAALAKGVCPLLIRPALLQNYIPFLAGVATDLKGRATITLTGSPAKSDEHPKILRPRPVIYRP